MALERRRVEYNGRVQGVGFRYTAQRLAPAFGVSGSVRNLADGRVELEAQGEPSRGAAFLDAIPGELGLTTISFVCPLPALLTASSTVAEEIEGKTAITLLSKPITRRQFIIGKYLGIELGVLLMFLILGAAFLGGVWYKYAYDLREAAG